MNNFLVDFEAVNSIKKKIEEEFDIESIKFRGEKCWHSIVQPICFPRAVVFGEDGRVKKKSDSQSTPFFLRIWMQRVTRVNITTN